MTTLVGFARRASSSDERCVSSLVEQPCASW
jgi:hypothetical protein